MADNLAGVFRDDIPVIIRITNATIRTALGVPDADIQLKKATLREGGAVLAEFESGGNVTKYLLSLNDCYLRQVQPTSTLPQPPQG